MHFNLNDFISNVITRSECQELSVQIRQGTVSKRQTVLLVCVFQVLNHLHKKLKNMSKKSEASKKKVIFTNIYSICHISELSSFLFLIILISTTACGI